MGNKTKLSVALQYGMKPRPLGVFVLIILIASAILLPSFFNVSSSLQMIKRSTSTDKKHVSLFSVKRHVISNKAFKSLVIKPSKNNKSVFRNDTVSESYVCDDCFNFDFDLVINEPDICKNNIYVLILILSRPSSQLVRETIRNTWASKCAVGQIRCLFVFGNDGNSSNNVALAVESRLHNDVIQYDFQESYKNLTYKTMVSLKWASQYCPNAKYVMKTDDDSFVNIELLNTLLKAAPLEKFYGGRCQIPFAPKRKRSSKWYITLEEYPYEMYPRYCLGSGYILSMDLVPKVVSLARNIPYFFIEDVYIGINIDRLGIKPTYLNGFHVKHINKMRSCKFRGQVFTVHKLSSKGILDFWEKTKGCKNFKPTPPKDLYNSTVYSSY